MPRKNAIRERVNQVKQDLILEQAIDLFYESGYQGTTMEAIATALGVTKPFLYYRYKSKEDILVDVLARYEELAVAQLREQVNTVAPPDVKLRAAVRYVVDSALAHYKLIAVYYTEEQNLPPKKIVEVRKRRREWESALEKLLEDGKRAKLFQYGDARIAVNAVLGTILWSYHWFADDFGVKKQKQVADELCRAALAVVGCPEN